MEIRNVEDLLQLFNERGSLTVRISQRWVEVGYPDPGMLCDVLSVRDSGWGVEVSLDAEPHLEYNRPLERNDWLDKEGRLGNIRESGEPFSYRLEVIIPKRRTLEDFLSPIGDKTLEHFNEWKKSGRGESYIDWLENRC